MQHPMAVTHGRNTRIISKAVAIPPERPKITTCADGMVVSEKQTISFNYPCSILCAEIYLQFVHGEWSKIFMTLKMT